MHHQNIYFLNLSNLKPMNSSTVKISKKKKTNTAIHPFKITHWLYLYLQISFFLYLILSFSVLSVYFAENLNELAAKHWQ